MQKRGNRICPCCGKSLILMGEVLGDDIHEGEFGHGYRRNPPSMLYMDAFEKDRIWSSSVKMFCSECGVNIELQRNPVKTAIFVLIFPIFIWMLFFIYALSFRVFKGLLYATLPVGVLAAIMLVYVAVLLPRVKKYRSNFVFSTETVLQFYTSELYHPVSPNIRLVMCSEDLHDKNTKKYLLTGNVFSAELARSNFYLYLMSVDVQNGTYNLEFRICGTRADAVRFTGYINGISDSSGFRLALRFEGKVIGNAEVSEVYRNSE